MPAHRPPFPLRLRQRALRCYEVGLYALLLAMAAAVGLPPASAGEEAQCGNAQSSTVVMAR